MKRLRFLFLFFIIFITTSFFFQNCGKMEATRVSSEGDGADGDDYKCKPANDFRNREDIGQLDKKLESVADGSSVVFNLEEEERVNFFQYETTHLAVCKSTVVTIKRTEGENETQFDVKADQCKKSISMTSNEIETLKNLIEQSLENLNKRDPSVTRELGCSFPRLVMNRGQWDQYDFDIYYSSRPGCVPSNALFVSDTSSNGQPLEVIQEIESFFDNKIDSLCQSETN